MSRSVPTHVLVLDRMEDALNARLDAHRIKAGDGLPEAEYRAIVGRIRETKVLLEEIAALRKQLRTDDDIDQQESNVQKRKRRS